MWIEKNGNAVKEQQAVHRHAEDLKARQSLLLTKLEQCQSLVVQKKLEAEIEALEDQIHKAGRQRRDHALKRDEVDAYFEIAKHLLEHPGHYAFKAETKGELEKIWSFVFVSLPSYRDLSDGTPDLRPIYRLSRQSTRGKSQLASQLSAQWNTFENDVRDALEQDWGCLVKDDRKPSHIGHADSNPVAGHSRADKQSPGARNNKPPLVDEPQRADYRDLPSSTAWQAERGASPPLL